MAISSQVKATDRAVMSLQYINGVAGSVQLCTQLKLGRCDFQIRPPASETGQYPQDRRTSLCERGAAAKSFPHRGGASTR